MSNKLYCKNCDNDSSFGYVEESDYEVSSNDVREICEDNLIRSSGYYYCQICKGEV